MKPGELRPGLNVADELERDRIIRQVRAAYYNRIHPLAAIEYDPDGEMQAMCAKLGIDWLAMVAWAEGR